MALFRKFGYLVLDFIMIFLLVINLSLIVFDWLFEYALIQDFLYRILPDITERYASKVHPRFILIDLLFVSVFLAEFFVRWAVAVYHKTYHRWFFFPFIHFYDLLGCIPVGGFRFLRLLRIVSIVVRLHKHGLLNLAETAPGRFIRKYYAILLEELSDRVTLNILSDMQEEIRHGGPALDRIIREAVIPHKETLVDWTSHRIEKVASDNYGNYQERLKEYVEEKIADAARENNTISRLDSIPFLGTTARQTLENAITDIVYHVINGMMQDLASNRNKVLINEAADILFDAVLFHEDNAALNELVIHSMEHAIEIMKQQVKVQKWKLRDLSADDEDYRARIKDEMARFDPDGSLE
ncbi:hypothetical protein QLX67_03405 [Balneolaceae bacterium ANBcel3]|nr:hypothetical protein [Balneolaceae bacterium ANBcel3]